MRKRLLILDVSNQWLCFMEASNWLLVFYVSKRIYFFRATEQLIVFIKGSEQPAVFFFICEQLVLFFTGIEQPAAVFLDVSNRLLGKKWSMMLLTIPMQVCYQRVPFRQTVR